MVRGIIESFQTEILGATDNLGKIDSPDAKMVWAIIFRAMTDYVNWSISPQFKDSRHYKEEVQLLEEWFLSDSEDEFSFLWYCNLIESDSDSIPRLVFRLIEQAFKSQNVSKVKLLSRSRRKS